MKGGAGLLIVQVTFILWFFKINLGWRVVTLALNQLKLTILSDTYRHCTVPKNRSAATL